MQVFRRSNGVLGHVLLIESYCDCFEGSREQCALCEKPVLLLDASDDMLEEARRNKVQDEIDPHAKGR